MRLKDKVIIVTGSTMGIGHATAARFVAEGARVLIHGLEQDNADAVAKLLGSTAAGYAHNLLDPEAPKAIIAKAVEAFGRIDGLVNNAAMTGRAGLDEVTDTIFENYMAINARAPMMLIREALPHLIETKGAVVNIGSINAYCGEAELLPYSMSKGALMTMTRNLADQLAVQQVRVNQMNVGWVLTDNEYKIKTEIDGLPADWPDHLPKSYAPSGGLIRPEDIAAALVYWISEESRPISGSVVELEQYPIIGRNPVKEGL